MAKRDGGVQQRGKPAKKAPQAAVTESESAGAGTGTGAGDAVLWEEIRKLGGDMDDLNLLQDIDTGKSGKSSAKSQKVDKKALQGDLTAFAKSLGLATSIPDFVGLTESERKKVSASSDKKSEIKKGKESRAAKSDPSATEATPKTATAVPTTTAASTKKEKKSKDSRDSKGDVVATAITPKAVIAAASTTAPSTPAKKEKKDSKKAADTPEDVVDIPGFKVKSAKDSLPLSKSSKLSVEPTPQWFSVTLGALETDESAAKPTEDEVLQKFAFAEQLLDGENTQYDKQGASKKSLSTSDRSFVSNILSSGTLSDRVSALTLIVQESPVHNVRSLGQLMAMVQKKNRREALMAVGSVKDLMSLNLLPPNRKLKYFADQPINARGITNAHWIMWAFEDKLKRHYFDLIQVMESMSYDPVLHTRQNMVNYFEELLEQKPEQEQNLLRLLVNKLGDNERQLAAKASYLLLKLLNVHPNMKYVVVKTVQELLLTKSSTKERTQYYTMITLNQIILSSKDVATANLLLEVYFIFFTKLLKITKDNDEAEAEAANDEVDSDSEKKASKTAAANKTAAAKKGAPKKVYIGQKAMLKAKEDAEKKRAEEERSMDNKLLAAILTGLNRALPFSKMEDEVMDKHIGVIFQIAHAGNFNTVVQSLVLLNQVVRVRPGVGDRFYRTLYDSLLDPRLDSTSKKAMYLNVLYRALKADSNMARVMAFIKRIMQVCLYNQAEFVSGALFLVSQILSLNPQIYTMLTQPEDNDDDDAKAEAAHTKYDAQKRDPRYAQADSSCMWEATLLMHHFHPSVTHSISQIFDGEQVPAISNLHNHSLTHFLDRFVFRKPKGEEGGQVDEDGERIGAPPTAKSSMHRGQSIMQPVIQKDGPDMEVGPNRTRVAAGNHLIASKRTGVVGGLDLTLETIADLQKSDVPPDEQFFHQFFQTKKARMGKKVKKSKRSAAAGNAEFADDDTGFAGAVKDDNELDEDEVWQAMTASMPKASGDDEADAGEFGADGDDDLLAALREGESDSDDDGDGDDVSDDESEDQGSGGDDSDEDEDDGSDSGSDIDGFPGFDDEISDTELDMGEQEEDSATPDTPLGTKRKGKGKDEPPASSSKRKKSEKMPLFGSFDDYAHLIDNDEGLE
ncbi:RNA-binding ribosome biosynthesis protein mak21 [Coemansia sp. BCRC 34962]|nr:RNA-binding ribosome biosynthesis protein mak21 [Coemansia sp. BCRC 34962]